MRSILIPLDGSTFAERALPLARGIAVRTGARVHLVAVHQPALTSHGGRGAPTVDPRLDAELRAELGRYLDRAKADLIAAAPTLSGAAALLEGPVVESLARYAGDIEADLIVLGTHGFGGPSEAWLGSVTEGLVRAVATPILAVRPSDGTAARPEGGFSRVVVALDESPQGDEAIASAVAVAGSEGVEYTLLRVVQPLHPFLGVVATRQAYEDDLRTQRGDAEAYLAAQIERLRPQGLQVRPEVRVDESPARAIVASAGALRAEFIAMATHGRGALGRILLGSVADKVLRAAPCPVLLRRPAAAPLAPDLPEPARARRTEAAIVRTESGAGDGVPPVAELRRMLVATDFAIPSCVAATWTARHLLGDAELVLLHAVPMVEPPAFLAQSLPAREELVETVRRGAEARLGEMRSGVGTPRLTTVVRAGPPADAIVAAARDRAADLIVIGAHGPREGISRLLGSTVERVVRGAHVPVLLARNPGDAPPRRLMVAIDDSAEAPHLFAWASLLAARFHAAVVVLHVVGPLYSGAIQLGTAGVDPQPALDRLREGTSRWLDGQVAPLRGRGYPVTTVVAFGDPGFEIVAAARRLAADLVLIGRGGVGHPLAALVGSATQHVLRAGDGPVLVVPPLPRRTASS